MAFGILPWRSKTDPAARPTALAPPPQPPLPARSELHGIPDGCLPSNCTRAVVPAFGKLHSDPRLQPGALPPPPPWSRLGWGWGQSPGHPGCSPTWLPGQRHCPLTLTSGQTPPYLRLSDPGPCWSLLALRPQIRFPDLACQACLCHRPAGPGGARAGPALGAVGAVRWAGRTGHSPWPLRICQGLV